jgi:hypothetical protein
MRKNILLTCFTAVFLFLFSLKVNADPEIFVDLLEAHQGMTQENFLTLKQQGVKGIVIRLANGKKSSKPLLLNPVAKQQIEFARAADLKVSVSFLSTYQNPGEALEEANIFVDLIKKLGLPPSTPLVNVLEDPAMSFDRIDQTPNIQAFKQQIALHGFANVYYYCNIALLQTTRIRSSELGGLLNFWLEGEPPVGTLGIEPVARKQGSKNFPGISAPISLSIDYAGIFTSPGDPALLQAVFEREKEQKECMRLEEELLIGQRQSADLAAAIEAKEKQLADLVAKTTAEKKRVADLNASSATEQQSLTDLTTKATTKQKQLSDLAAKNAIIQKQLADLVAKSAAEQKSTNDLTAQIATMQKQLADLTAKTTVGQKSASELAAKSATAQKQLSDLSAKSAAEQKSANNLTAQIAANQKQLSELIAKVAAEQQRFNDLASKSAAEQRRKSDLSSRAQAEQRHLDDVTRAADAAQRDNGRLREEWDVINSLIPVYRMFNGRWHLFTTNANEARNGYHTEHRAFFAGGRNLQEVQRYRHSTCAHRFVVNTAEVGNWGGGWIHEGVGFRVSTDGAEIYRLYSPHSHDFILTANSGERDHLRSHGWHDWGVAFRAYRL